MTDDDDPSTEEIEPLVHEPPGAPLSRGDAFEDEPAPVVMLPHHDDDILGALLDDDDLSPAAKVLATAAFSPSMLDDFMPLRRAGPEDLERIGEARRLAAATLDRVELLRALDEARDLARRYRNLHPDSRNNPLPWETPPTFATVEGERDEPTVENFFEPGDAFAYPGDGGRIVHIVDHIRHDQHLGPLLVTAAGDRYVAASCEPAEPNHNPRGHS